MKPIFFNFFNFKKAGVIFFLSFFIFSSAFSQGVWTWVKGDSMPGGGKVFGTQGIPSAGNNPPGVYEPCEWTDQQGNFWLLGGLDTSNNVNGDLWKYNPTTNEWTWMKGSGIPGDSGNYGTRGVAAPSNRPPARGWGVSTWVDLNNNLWMYGGANHNDGYSDLWKFNIASNTWTWVQGSSISGVQPQYGTQGIPSPTNTPGARWECSATWVDSVGNLWLYGGYNFGSFGDLWKYTIATNQWTWMNGTTTRNLSGVYGNFRVPDVANTPGSRQAYCSWKDLNEKFWLFGGAVYLQIVYLFNDMWKYDPANNEWAWMSGTNQLNNTGNYGTLCNSSQDFVPGMRFENRARWIDNCGKFWMFGGFKQNMARNDLWNFDPVTYKWTLTSGDTSVKIFPVFGTMGVPDLANRPGIRAGAVSWKRNDGTLYLFGGERTFALSNDLWMYNPDPACPVVISTKGNINRSRDSLCAGSGISSVLKTTDISGSLQWQSSTNGINFLDIPFADSSSYLIPPTLAQTTYYRLVATGGNCGADTSNVVPVHIVPPPVDDFIATIKSNKVTFSSLNAPSNIVSYQWDFGDGGAGTGIHPTHTYSHIDTFTVCLTVYNNSNCSYTICHKIDLLTGVETIEANNFINLYPNPANNTITLSAAGLTGSYTLKIYNVLGQLVMQQQLNLNATATIPVNLHNCVQGAYELVLMNDKDYYSKRFVKGK